MQYNYKKIWQISYPILVGMIIQQLIGLTDTAFLGRVGEVELGASAIAGIFYIMIFMLGYGFSVGAQIIIARRNGEQKYHRIGSVFYQGISFLLLGAALIIGLSLWMNERVLHFIISSEDVYRAAADYLDVRVYGFLFAFMIVMFRAFFVGVTDTRPLAFNALVMLFANIFLDYILIFGKLGFPAMGIRGAALASVISEALSALFFIIYTLVKVDLIKFGFKWFSLSFGILKDILHVSIWTMLQAFLSLGSWFIFFVAIEHLGTEALAISNILRSLSSLPFMIAAALGAAANSITSNLLGSNGDLEVMPAMKKIISLGYLLGLPCVIIMALFPAPAMRIYTDNPALITAAHTAYYTMLTTYLTLVPGMILFSAVSGTGHTKTALVMELISMTFYIINVVYVVIYLRADVAICWLSEHSYNIVLWWLAYTYMKSRRWWCVSKTPSVLSEAEQCARI